MRTIIIATLCTTALLIGAACTTTPEEQAAKADERKPGATKPGTQTVQPPKVAAVDVTKRDAPSALKDPSNILSNRSVYYDFDKFDVKEEYRPLVEAHGKYLRENPSAKMLIQGNTDERGSREYNLALGQKRAEAVKKALLLQGATEAQIEAVSLGEEKPRCKESVETCWSQNRRSDMLYTGEF